MLLQGKGFCENHVSTLLTGYCHSFLMCPADQLHEQAGWEGPISSSRERLLANLSSQYLIYQVISY